MQLRSRVVGSAIAIAAVLLSGSGLRAQNLPFLLFERYLDPLRISAGIPGLSAVIVQDGQVLWERGFGARDLESNLEALPSTPYPIGDLTQTITATLLLHCMERGVFGLDQPLSQWVPNAEGSSSTLRQLLTHAAPTAANGFRYAPARFALLARPVEACFDQPYRKVVAREVFDRLAMTDAVPGRDIGLVPPELRQLFDESTLLRYANLVSQTATAYKVDRRGRATRNDAVANGVDGASGLIASARDLAKFDIAPAVHLRPETLALAWTNTLHNGAPTPFGLGWFVQTYNGEKLVWHFGHISEAYSSLILKVPGRRLTLILLANSDGLSAPFPLHDGDVTSSLFARTFLRLFLS
jgi:CubicO group peptidase (beta-lactamase class C family)